MYLPRARFDLTTSCTWLQWPIHLATEAVERKPFGNRSLVSKFIIYTCVSYIIHIIDYIYKNTIYMIYLLIRYHLYTLCMPYQTGYALWSVGLCNVLQLELSFFWVDSWHPYLITSRNFTDQEKNGCQFFH